MKYGGRNILKLSFSNEWDGWFGDHGMTKKKTSFHERSRQT